MRIAHFTSGFPVLSETFVRDEIAAFASAGFSNVVVSLRPEKRDATRTSPPHEADPALAIESVLYPRISLGQGLNPFAGPVTIANSLRDPAETTRNLYLRSVAPRFIHSLARFGVIHCHAHFAHYPSTLAWICASRLGLGYSFNAHSYDLFKYRSFLREKVGSADRIFPISERNRNRLLQFADPEGAAEDKIEVVHCGIDLSEYPFQADRTAPSEPPLLLAVGRLVDTKGFDSLIEAIPELSREIPSVRVEIVGEGPERSRLLELARRLGVAARLSLPGALDRGEVRARQAQATLVIQPCRPGRDGLDGIPVVLMEAMALGTPVVSTHFEAIPELVEDGVSGRLVPSGDAPALARAILDLLAGRQDREALARNARAVVEARFDGPRNYREKAAAIARFLESRSFSRDIPPLSTA